MTPDTLQMEDSTGLEVLIRAMFDQRQAEDMRRLREANVILTGGK